jgi:hypothetical protein
MSGGWPFYRRIQGLILARRHGFSRGHVEVGRYRFDIDRACQTGSKSVANRGQDGQSHIAPPENDPGATRPNLRRDDIEPPPGQRIASGKKE